MSYNLKRALMQAGFVIGYSLAVLVDNTWIQMPALALGVYVTFQYGRAWERTGKQEDE